MPKLRSNFFTQEEFEAAGFPTAPTALETFLLRNLMIHVLDPIRSAVGSPCHINDCYRSYTKYIKMQSSYNPSPTSDHFWGQAIPSSDPKTQERFGPYFCYGVGAVDIKFPNGPAIESVFALIRTLKLPLGQCILEVNGSSKWIHVSNPKTLCYSAEVIEAVGLAKVMYLTSDDNGKTYKAVA